MEIEELMLDYYVSEMTTKEFADQHNIEVKTLNTYKQQYHLVIEFDEKLFFQRFSQDYKKLKRPEMLKKYSLNRLLYDAMERRYARVSYSKLLRMLRVAHIAFDITVIKTTSQPPRGVTMNFYGFENIVRKKKKLTPEEKKNISEMNHLIETQFNVIKEIMVEKQMHPVLQKRINTLVRVLINQSTLLGIQFERNGFSDTIESGLYENIDILED